MPEASASTFPWEPETLEVGLVGQQVMVSGLEESQLGQLLEKLTSGQGLIFWESSAGPERRAKLTLGGVALEARGEALTAGVSEFIGLVRAEDRDFVHERLTALFERGCEMDMRYALDIPGLGQRWVRGVGHAVPREGEVGHVVGVILDITNEEERSRLLRLAQHELNGLAVPTCTLDLTGRVLAVNDATVKALGYTREELKSMSAWQFTSKSGQRDWPLYMRKVKEKGCIERQITLTRKDGSSFPAAGTLRAVDFEGQTLLLATLVDITEQLRLDEVLEAHRALETEVSQLSARLICTTSEQLDREVDHAISVMGRAVLADRLAVFVHSQQKGPVVLDRFWERPGSPVLPPPPNISARVIPLLLSGTLAQGEVTCILAGEHPFREHFLAQGMTEKTGLIVVPLWQEGEQHGTVIFRWEDTSLYLVAKEKQSSLRLFGDLLARAYQRKKSEAAMLLQEQSWRSLLATVHGMVYRCRKDENWTLDLASEGAYGLTGYPPDELIGVENGGFAKLVHPEDLERLAESCADAIACRRNLIAEYRIVCKDGQIKHVWETTRAIRDADDRVIALEGFVADITELHRTRQERDAFFRASPHLMAIFDGRFQLNTWNPAWNAVLGWDDHELQGVSWTELIHPEDVERTRRECRQQIEEIGWVQGVENRYRCKDGSYRWLLWSSVVLGSERHTFAYATDITERKQAEEERRALQQRVDQALRLEALSSLAGGLAHDLNNLLTAVITSLERLQDLHGHDERSDRYLRRALGSALDSAGLVDQLLALGRRQHLEQLSVNPIELVNLALERLPEELLHGVKVSVDQPALRDVRGDATLLRQVVLNLLKNAATAVRDVAEPHVIVRITDRALDESAAHPLGLTPGDYVELQIIDNGHGMDEAVRERLFNPYFSTRERGSGHGLGLSMAWGVVSQHGGIITVDSAPGRGSCFTVLLPTSDEPSVRPVVPRVELRAASWVLVVEDNPDLREMVVEMLELSGYVVRSAPDAEEVLEDLLNWTVAPRLLISDVVLPGASGVALAERLRNRFPGLPVCFMSGYAWETLLKEGRLPPDAPFLRKPFSSKNLMSQVAQLIGPPNSPQATGGVAATGATA